MRCSVSQYLVSVLQCVAVCCSVLQCVAVRFALDSVLQCVAVRVWNNLMQRVAVFGQCVAVCCSVLQYVVVRFALDSVQSRDFPGPDALPRGACVPTPHIYSSLASTNLI